MTVRRPYVVHCRLTFGELKDFREICKDHNLTVQDMLRAMITDVIAEESDVRRKQSAGRAGGTKASKGCGAAA